MASKALDEKLDWGGGQRERSEDEPGGQGHAVHRAREYEEEESVHGQTPASTLQMIRLGACGIWAFIQRAAGCVGLSRHLDGQQRESLGALRVELLSREGERRTGSQCQAPRGTYGKGRPGS